MEYRKEIDGIRAFAILPVIFFHADFPIFAGGFIGVDIFFVISGFLITSLILSEISENKFSITKFYERRIRRLLPALFSVTLFSLIIGFFIFTDDSYKFLGITALGTMFFSNNIILWRKSGYFEPETELNPLMHTWSLSIEEQFYLIFPIFLLFLIRFKLNLILSFCVVFIFSFFVAITFSKSNPIPAFYLLPSRAFELMLGCIIATHGFYNKYHIKSNIADLFSLIGFTLISFSIFFYNKETIYPGYMTLMPALGSGMLIYFSQHGLITKRFLSNQSLCQIGLISYSLYLWHQPIIAFTKTFLANQFSLHHMFYALLASFFLAIFSYRYIEKPFRNRNFLTQKKLFNITLLSIIFISSICLLIIKSDNLLNRLSQNKEIFGELGQDNFYNVLENFEPCKPDNLFIKSSQSGNSYKHINRCRQSVNISSNKIIIFGDSHAEHLFPGVSNVFSNHNIILFNQMGPPLISNKNFEYLFEQLEYEENVEYILFAGFWEVQAERMGSNFRDDLKSTIDFLSKFSNKVIFITDIPNFRFSPENCIRKTLINISKCEIPAETFIKQKSSYINQLPGITDNFKVIEIDKLFCDDKICQMNYMDRILYRDEHHLNIFGSNLAAKFIAKNLENF